MENAIGVKVTSQDEERQFSYFVAITSLHELNREGDPERSFDLSRSSSIYGIKD